MLAGVVGRLRQRVADAVPGSLRVPLLHRHLEAVVDGRTVHVRVLDGPERGVGQRLRDRIRLIQVAQRPDVHALGADVIGGKDQRTEQLTLRPDAHWWKYSLRPSGLIARILMRVRSSFAGSRKSPGKPSRSMNSGAVLVVNELLIRDGGFKPSWSSLPIRSNTL